MFILPAYLPIACGNAQTTQPMVSMDVSPHEKESKASACIFILAVLSIFITLMVNSQDIFRMISHMLPIRSSDILVRSANTAFTASSRGNANSSQKNR